MLIGFFLLGLGYWSYAAEGFGSSTLLCGAAAAVFFFRGAQGMAAGEAGNIGDSTAIVDFVTNPAEAIVDTATDRLSDWVNSGDVKPATADEHSKFDPDAVLARYIEKRGAGPTAAPAAAAPIRSFGRKGA